MSSYGGHRDDDDDFVHVRRSPSHSRGGRGRDYSPDYHSGGYMAGAMPVPPPVAIPAYEQNTPFYPPPERKQISNSSLQVPTSPARPRSTPPYSRRDDRDRRDSTRDRSRNRSRDRSRGRNKDKDSDSDPDAQHSRPRSPLGKAKHVLQHTFSDSTSGLGVGVLGAIIGGMAAREASEAAGRRGSHSRHSSNDHKGTELLSTIVGAAVGGLGANALEKRIEKSRGKTKGDQEKWEKKFGRDGGDKDRRDGRQGPEQREKVRERERERERERDRVGREMEEGRSGGGGGKRVSGERRRGGYDESDSEPEYVYDRRPRRRSEDEMRYRS